MGKDLKGKELGKGISQRKDKLYIARFTTKTGNRKSKLFEKLKEGQKWLADEKYLDEHSQINLSSDILVDAWFDNWIKVKDKGYAYNTVREYKARYKKNIQPVIGKKFIRDIIPIQCQMVLNNMAETGYKRSTICLAKNVMSSMFEYAFDNHLIANNPCNKLVEAKIGEDSTKKEALNLNETKKFVDQIKGFSYEYQYLLVLQSGLRIGELIGLKWSDIDFKNKTMTIRRSIRYHSDIHDWVIGNPKSESGCRTIPLTDEAIRILTLQKEKTKNFNVIDIRWKDTVFICKYGTPIKNGTYDSNLVKICKKACIRNISMHVLRYTFATRCANAGMMPKTLQYIMGHANITTTMNLYVSSLEEQRKGEIADISSRLVV